MSNTIRVLYTEDNPLDADLTLSHFESDALDFDMEIVRSGTDCLKRLSGQKFDVLLLDMRLPDMDGLDVLSKLRSDGFMLPVVMVTGLGDEETVAKSLRAGAADYVSKADQAYLISLPDILRKVVARQYTRSHEVDLKRSSRQILYIEPNAMDVELTAHYFSEHAPHLKLQVANSSREALALLVEGQSFDLVLTDLRVPDMSALELIRETQHRGIDLPFIVITGKGDETTAVAALRLGAYDYLVKRKNYLMQLPHAVDHALHRFHLDQTTRRLHAELVTLNASLEQKVRERTAELTSEIAVRKQAESSSHERESQLDAIVENLTEGLVVSNLEGQLLHFNRAALDLYGFASLEECRKHLSKFADIFELSTMDGTILPLEEWPPARVLRGEKLNNLELYIRHVEAGWLRIFNYGGTLVHDAKGLPMMAIVTMSDITLSKQAEIDLRIAAASFESQECIMITDADGVILRVNNAFVQSTGYTASEAIGHTPRLLKSGRHDEAFYLEMWAEIHRNGSWQGEIWDKRKNGEIYPKWLTITAVRGENNKITHYVGSHVDITERKAAEDKIQHLAFYDSLTGLPNRQLLLDRLQQALTSSIRVNREVALLFIDLDHFKNLNDTLGHLIGDKLLLQVAHRLQSCVRDGDTVARLGGDEFVVLLVDLSAQPFEAATQTEAIGEKILSSLRQSYQLDSHLHLSTASIGVTLFIEHKASVEELMKQADIAMYQAKKAGRNTLRFFDPQMQKSISARVSMEEELHKALEKKQFQLHYQIQVDSSRRNLGAEALIRWQHSERGSIPPAQFIPLAEETGLILPIGIWVLETACAQIKLWEKEELTRGLLLAVNVSAKQFHQPAFVEQVQTLIKRHAINPKLLKLELTEGMLLENIEETIATMNALKKIGVQFSLDDFGTGYSSLQYLKRLPLDQLKIDQSFVRDIATDSSDKAIVRTIIAIAHSLNLEVIAEGVETDEQQQFLLDNACTHFQGYLFGRPVSIDQFEASLKPD